MTELFESLDFTGKIFFICAGLGGLLFIVRMIMFFVGGDLVDADGDFDADSTFWRC